MSQAEHDQQTAYITTMRCRAILQDTSNEIACQNLDAKSHALLDEWRQRVDENLAMSVGVTLQDRACDNRQGTQGTSCVRQADGG
jgi:hypothetical protein